MSTPKQDALKLLEGLEDDVSWEQIQYHLYVRQKIERGMDQAEAGDVLTQEEVARRLAKLLGGP